MLRNRMHIIANWKMHGDSKRVTEWVRALEPTLDALPANIQAVFCPPSLWLEASMMLAPGTLAYGAQNCHAEAQGAFTGEISAAMLASIGARYVILGHSERRAHANETSEQVAAKAKAASNAGITPIICIGETKADRDAGNTIDIICAQLKASVPKGLGSYIIAYEPVWAIGTGITPTNEDIEAAHASIIDAAAAHQLTRDSAACVVYGGSVNSTNAASILALRGVAGALVGGASLDAAQFATILKAASSCTKAAV